MTTSDYTKLNFLRDRFLVDAVPPTEPRKRQERIITELPHRAKKAKRKWYTEEDANDDLQGLLKEEAEAKEKLSDLRRKAVQWCTNKPQEVKDLLVAVTAAYGNEPATECFYASAMLFVEVPPCSSDVRNYPLTQH